jgi:hypothetical protein
MNTTSDITTYIQTIYEDAMHIARENTLMTRLVNVFNDRTGIAVRTRSEYNEASFDAIAETDDLNSQLFTPSTGASLTPAEFGAQFFFTDLRMESDPFEVRSDGAIELGMAAATAIDTALVNDFDGFTGGTVGAAGTVNSWGRFWAMASILRAQKAPKPWFYVVHPYSWYPLGQAAAPGATVTNSPAFQDRVAGNFFVGNAGGIDIFTSSNITIDGDDDAYAGMFSRTALGYDNRRAPRLEPERDASRRGIELNLTAVYAHGVWRPKFGVQGLFDASVPTGN